MTYSLIFATSNPHKIAEARGIIGARIQLLSLKEAGYENLVLEETAETIHGNAMQKARILYDLSAQDCFAEDTGLEVDALHGAPGVYTARYAGDKCDPTENIHKLLCEMRGEIVRTARFRTVIALIMQRAMYFFEGIVEGTIAEHPRGNSGFGYDPVFIPSGYAHTFAELPTEIKNALSHRSRALHQMMAFLQSGVHK